MQVKKKITFIHLLNDYSGSPLVLSNVIKGLRDQGYDCEVMTSKNTEGFLSEIVDVHYNNFGYHFIENKLYRLALFFWTQMVLFFKTLFQTDRKSTIYINTLLPFGAALAGKLRRQKVVYHIHETSLKPLAFKNFLKWIARKTSTVNIYVSNYLEKKEGIKEVTSSTIHNALSDSFKKEADHYKQNSFDKNKKFNVLMLCSLKEYKGVNEFVGLSKMLPDIHFSLILNCSKNTIQKHFSSFSLPSNLTILSTQKNVHPFYAESHLVVNLSHPEKWVETFGMTILEGMYYGLPSIAPPIGGPVEIIKNKRNGFLIDQRNLKEIAEQIDKLAMDKAFYQQISSNALIDVQQFSYQKNLSKIREILEC